MMQSRSRQIVLGVAILIIVQAVAITLYLTVTRSRSTPGTPRFAAETLAPRPSPALTFSRADGTEHSLGELRGKVVMVHFWATWCEPCRRELPGLLSLAERLRRERGFELIAVSVDDEWPEIRSFFDGKIPEMIVRPTASEVHRQFGASTLPDTYLVNGRSEIVMRYAGARDWTTEHAARQLSETIAKQRVTR